MPKTDDGHSAVGGADLHSVETGNLSYISTASYTVMTCMQQTLLLCIPGRQTSPAVKAEQQFVNNLDPHQAPEGRRLS